MQIAHCFVAMKPSTISIVDKSAVSIEVSWAPLPSQVNNGRIHGYRVCHKLASSDLPSEKSCFVSRNATSYLVQDLTPYTQYDIEISARTMAGYGPAATLSARTNESSKVMNKLFIGNLDQRECTAVKPRVQEHKVLKLA